MNNLFIIYRYFIITGLFALLLASAGFITDSTAVARQAKKNNRGTKRHEST